MATKIPPHNLTEILDATIALIKNPDISIDELIKIVPGPDFPTAGFIYGREEIHRAYREGRGIIQMRAKAGDRPHRPRRTRARRRRHHRDPVSGKQGPADRKDRRACPRKEARRHFRDPRRIEPRRNAHRHRAKTRRDSAGRSQQAVQADADAVVVRHHQHRDRRRPAEAAEPQADARGVCRVPPRGRPPPDRIRPSKGAGTCTHFGRPEQGDRRARLHHSADPQFAFGR